MQMLSNSTSGSNGMQSRGAADGMRSVTRGMRVGAALLVLLGAATAAQQAPIQPVPRDPSRSIILPEANRPLDANQQMLLREHNAKTANFEAANELRKKQLSDDTAHLLTLAMALKAEVDKTNKDTLSLNVIRKADEIEKLAHTVKEKMKLTVGGS